MKVKRALLATLTSIAALAVALTFVLNAGAEAPSITVLNSGGVPTTNTSKCEFTLRFEICKITVTNNSAFNVKIKKIEIIGPNPNARYGIVTSGCVAGEELAATGGSCTDEVKLLIDKPNCPNFWLNGYFIEVEQVGVPANHIGGTATLKVT